MKEGELKPGDKVGKWTITRHIANDCVYGCVRSGDDTEYAMKIREPGNLGYLKGEIEMLRRLTGGRTHPCFQQVIDHCEDPENLYMVLSPLAKPERKFDDIALSELAKVNPIQFLFDFLGAVKYAALFGIRLGSIGPGHFFVSDDGHPLFIGLCDEPIQNSKHVVLNFRLLADIFDRLIVAAEYRAANRRDPYDISYAELIKRTMLAVKIEGLPEPAVKCGADGILDALPPLDNQSAKE